jgi:hypothetical protein
VGGSEFCDYDSIGRRKLPDAQTSIIHYHHGYGSERIGSFRCEIGFLFGYGAAH